MVETESVCVTGGGGYQASWLIKLLLSKGYMVHATVRDPDNEKNAHLKTMENAAENLRLFKAELLDYDALFAAIQGCSGVFHLASPVLPDSTPNPEIEILQAAVTGTSNVLRACYMTKAKRVVVVSSICAVMHNPNWPKGQPMDESCWSDRETCKTAEPDWKYNWYFQAKTIAESQALQYGRETGINVLSVCPSLIIGPMLQSTLNDTGMFISWMLKGGQNSLANRKNFLVDVRDVAQALLLVYEKPEAEGRYICSSYTISTQELVHKLKSICPDYSPPNQITGFDEDKDFSSAKLQQLGWKFRSLEETILDSLKNYEEKGILV